MDGEGLRFLELLCNQLYEGACLVLPRLMARRRESEREREGERGLSF
jgi:hypothetical protein